jgi:hypothetical protein
MFKKVTRNYTVLQLVITNSNYTLTIVTTSQKVLGSGPYEAKFKVYLILLAALGPDVYSACN